MNEEKDNLGFVVLLIVFGVTLIFGVFLGWSCHSDKTGPVNRARCIKDKEAKILIGHEDNSRGWYRVELTSKCK